MQQLLPPQLAAWLTDPGRPRPLLLDVREPWEFELCHLEGAQLMPMQLVPVRCQELDPEQDIVVICHHGARSMQVALFLENRGFAAVHNLAGGVNAWAMDVDPAMRRY
ncbi:MAG: sulfurtransferase [Betaproteobacteria bacterium HGW-Betaproteobacteria-12]|nr:MAG: sulfurtransferase [Betaproteobacteria bacterium HGW-Betaproteobacteria-12]